MAMPLVTSCRLCSFACEEYKCLYDDNGETSEVYKVIIKYFHPSLLGAVTESAIKVICLECWQHIIDFYSFQQWILSAQTQEKDLTFIIKEEINDTDTNDSDTIDKTITTECRDDGNCLEEVSIFECSRCKQLFQSYVALEKHLKLHHSNVSANKEINTKLNFFERKAVKINNESLRNTFICETCKASFSQYGSLRRHVRKQHAVQPLLKWECKYCNKLFRKRLLLESHKNKFHNNQSCYNTRKTAKQVLDNKENSMIGSDTEVDRIFQQVLNVEEDQQRVIETSRSSKFSKKEDSEDDDIEMGINDNSSSADIKTKKQIHRPALEIVDVKSEISTDEESDMDINNINSTESNSDSDEKVDQNLEKRNDNLECPKCNQQVENYKQLKEHFDAEHPDERCYINCCHITLYEPQSILEHQQYHKNPNAFKCNECGKCFKGRKGLSSHKLQVHSDSRSPYHLHMCCCKKGVERHQKNLAAGSQMKYNTSVCCQRKKKILEDDELIAKWRKEITCEICKANFPYYSLMRSHCYHEHPGEKCYISCCQRKMSRISDTLEHVRFHLNPHLYQCQKCNVDFSGKSTLAKHMRNTHRDSLPPKHRWACDECDKTFQIRQILTRHKNVHHAKKV